MESVRMEAYWFVQLRKAIEADNYDRKDYIVGELISIGAMTLEQARMYENVGIGA